MLRYDISSCTCTILHTHLMLRFDIFSGTEFTDFQAQFDEVTTDQQHEKRVENVQIKHDETFRREIIQTDHS